MNAPQQQNLRMRIYGLNTNEEVYQNKEQGV
jgi:hypothetical protein